MTAVRERALQRLQEFEGANPEAAELACYASLATRVDSTLLRRLRLNLVRRASASAEADLWFSDLSESRDGESLVFDPGIAAVLREKLASQFLPDGRRALDVAFEHTRAVHHLWPATLQLEEELVYVALRDRAGAAAAIERLLRPAIAAMAANEQRGLEMSRWVMRALPRMPAIVLDTDAAAAMILAATAYIGADGDTLAGLETRPLPADLAWMLPPSVLARRTALACDVRANAMIFRAPIADESESVIEVPRTRPIVLELRWTDRAASGTRIVAVELEAPVPLPESWHQLELQSLSGETYRIERTLPRPAKDRRFENDVFISYAPADDHALAEGRDGWIATLRRALEIRLAQALGRQARIWLDPQLKGSDVFADTLRERLRGSAILVSVMSPRYAESDWCRRELNEFLEATGGGRVGDKSRVFKVMKTPVPPEQTPPPLQRMLGYEFFTVEPDSGRVRELSEIFGPEAQRAYWLKLDDLAHDIAGVLNDLEPESSPDRPGPSQRVVYLAQTSSDLKDYRDTIRRELESRGYAVVPDRPMPLTVDECTAFVREQLAGSQLSVHMVGQRYTLVPEGGTDSILALQLGIAGTEHGNRQRLIWIPPNLKVDDPRQQAFIDRLKADPGDLADVIEAPLEDFKVRLWDAVSRATVPIDPPGVTARRRVYVVCDQRDLEATPAVCDFLFLQGFEVLMPIFDADAAEARELHEQNLRTCDAVLIYFGAGNELWLRRQLRDIQKAASFGRVAPPPETAVYLALPDSPQKRLFRTHQARILAGLASPPETALAPFIAALK